MSNETKLIYGLKNCDSCRKARKALPEADFVDVRESGVPDDVLTRAETHFGEAFVNKRSTTWRGLSEEERKDAPLTLLRAHPTLMKRPLILVGDDLHLGWDKAVASALGVEAS